MTSSTANQTLQVLAVSVLQKKLETVLGLNFRDYPGEDELGVFSPTGYCISRVTYRWDARQNAMTPSGPLLASMPDESVRKLYAVLGLKP